MNVVTIKDVAGEPKEVVLCSATGATGDVKSMAAVVDLCSRSIVFQVHHHRPGKLLATSSSATLTKAVHTYNAITVK